MVEKFLYQVELPFSKQTVNFKEISTADQLYISKSLLALPNSDQKNLIVIQRLHLLLQNNVQNFDSTNLSIIEVFLLLLRIRAVSMGPVASLQVVSQSENKTTVEINFESVLKNLYLSLEGISEEEWLLEFTQNDITTNIKLGWPQWSDFKALVNIAQSVLEPHNVVRYILPFFILEMVVMRDKNRYEWLSAKTKNSLEFDKLPAYIQQAVQDRVLKMINHLAKIDLFGMTHLKDLNFNLFDPNLLEIFKMLFLFDLKDIHREIFILSPTLGSDYVLNLSDMERKLYLNFIPSTEEQSVPTPTQSLSPVQQLAKEFGE